MRPPGFLAGLAILFVLPWAAACRDGARVESPATTAPEDYTATVRAWRDKHEENYRNEYVSVSGLHLLEPGTYTLGSSQDSDIVISPRVPPAIGQVVVNDGHIRYDPQPGVPVLFDEAQVESPVTLKEHGSPSTGELVIGDVRVVVHQSGHRLWLRVRDPQANWPPASKDSAGFPSIPPTAWSRASSRTRNRGRSRS